MAVLDTVSTFSNVASASYLDVQPPSNVEWVIHEIYIEADGQIEWYNGSNGIILDTCGASGGWWSNLQMHLTNSLRIRIKNGATAAKNLGYSGVVSKA